MKKLVFPKKRLKKGFSLHFLKKFIICPGSVVAYHASLSSSRLGSESRPGRYYNFFKKRVKKYINSVFRYKNKWRSMKNIPVFVISIFLILNFFLISPKIYAQETITVGPGGPPYYDFSNIKDAIASANESDIIHVYSGTYTENIVINKSITLNGDSSGNTIIASASSNKNTIEVSANYVNISGFTIRNLGETFSCVKINSVNNCKISNCIIKNGGNGIYLIISNSDTITDNTIENNNIGIYLWNSNSNLVKSNKIQNNYANGVFISSVSSDNKIYLNDFSGNLDSNARDDGNNNWDYNYQGNYWDDYNDYDSNKDGIGDNPYIIDGNGGNKDNFPLGDFLTLDYKPIVISNCKYRFYRFKSS
jgi:parallel beta-helix repeat protein